MITMLMARAPLGLLHNTADPLADGSGVRPPRVLVCGSRDWTDRDLTERVLRRLGPATIIHGAARGADRIAGDLARRLDWPSEAYPADWRRFGRGAGRRRNIAMLDTRPVLVVAFTLIGGGTPGTRHTLTSAYRRGIPVVSITPGGAAKGYTPGHSAGSLGAGDRGD